MGGAGWRSPINLGLLKVADDEGETHPIISKPVNTPLVESQRRFRCLIWNNLPGLIERQPGHEVQAMVVQDSPL